MCVFVFVQHPEDYPEYPKISRKYYVEFLFVRDVVNKQASEQEILLKVTHLYSFCLSVCLLSYQCVCVIEWVVSKCHTSTLIVLKMFLFIHSYWLSYCLQCFDAVGWAAGKGIWPVKNIVVGCWRGYLFGARCRLAYGPADATATHCCLLQ